MVSRHVDISNSLVRLSQEFKGLRDSLQKEFEYLLSISSTPEFVLKSKKRQVDSISYMFTELEIIAKTSNALHIQKEKTELCLMYYGISLGEYISFINQPLRYIIKELDRNKKENCIQLSMVFQDLLNNEHTDFKEIKIATKPVFDIEKLKIAARNNPGFLLTGIEKLDNATKGIKV